MMEAKDTIITKPTTTEIIIREYPGLEPEFDIDYDVLDVVKQAQAEISFNMGKLEGLVGGRASGINEVVDWLGKNFEPTVPMSLDYRKWHTQLEKWGMK